MDSAHPAASRCLTAEISEPQAQARGNRTAKHHEAAKQRVRSLALPARIGIVEYKRPSFSLGREGFTRRDRYSRILRHSRAGGNDVGWQNDSRSIRLVSRAGSLAPFPMLGEWPLASFRRLVPMRACRRRDRLRSELTRLQDRRREFHRGRQQPCDSGDRR